MPVTDEVSHTRLLQAWQVADDLPKRSEELVCVFLCWQPHWEDFKSHLNFLFLAQRVCTPQGCVLPWIGVISESFSQASVLKRYFLKFISLKRKIGEQYSHTPVSETTRVWKCYGELGLVHSCKGWERYSSGKGWSAVLCAVHSAAAFISSEIVLSVFHSPTSLQAGSVNSGHLKLLWTEHLYCLYLRVLFKMQSRLVTLGVHFWHLSRVIILKKTTWICKTILQF